MGIFDWKHWIVLLVVVVLVFGTKKLKNFGSDLGESIKGFKKAMNEEESKPDEQTPASVQPVQPQAASPLNQPQTFEGQAHKVEEPAKKE
ncbi:twin-arginine translocase TatA/TatE family subunit [Pseudomonas rubra]|uniref:Sec-independent protein translocase protein TatA n=1 Tax=Pseudomonas rubra TaxID=2942627 RepID=A0ABT5P7C4_9PSED|nr:twin-arginine translocase TatA/TatE family subunit [Pseudomonas rubra]MDD1014057.1 twin-arginine translocase TatA/TatE family subunit [Pseudomonas rubra]MDD1038991.1 twin-arginine translocase TatA/TatE family subunit [Pseudomonas rubra]MDD1154255.1 twin-arginine translocase TatA/TatE family subunit [Pseudomonas rubra]